MMFLEVGDRNERRLPMGKSVGEIEARESVVLP
jgi:hypothetical protein